MQKGDRNNYKTNYLRNLGGFVQDMKEAKYFPTLRKFTYYFLMCELDDDLPECDYCDISCSVTEYRLPDKSLNVECFAAILQYVTWLLPLLMIRDETNRAYTMLKRTVYYFRFGLKDVKRIAFVSHIFVCCQYEVQLCTEPNVCRDFLSTLWSVLSYSIDVKKANNEIKVYFCFVSLFMADVHFRLGDKISSRRIVDSLLNIKLEKNNGDLTEFIECLLGYFDDLDTKYHEPLEVNLRLSSNLKLRILVAVCSDRLYATRSQCSNATTQTWIQRLSQIFS